MKTLQRLLALAAVVSLCGCFQVEDDLTIKPDGSGKVTLTVHTDLPDEALSMASMSSRGGTPMYPPIDEGEARHFFPSKDFSVKVDQKGTGDAKAVVIEASFKDINALLASPYGRAHQLSLSTNGQGVLKLQALSGASTLAQAAQFKAEGEMAQMLQMPGLAEAQKKTNEMRMTFCVTLPNSIQQANGPHQNQVVTWAVERAKCKDDAEFATKLEGVLEASCSSEGLQFAPLTPPRLGLLPFAQLVAGKSPVPASALPDTNKVLAAARVLSYKLQVTRTLDLSGEGAQASQAELSGAILLPAALAPQRWGEAKLEEATDAKGNSLMPKEDNEGFSQMRHYGSFASDLQSDSEETDETAPAKEPAEKPHLFSLSFKAPEWKVKQIAKIKGALDLLYVGGAEVLKLSNAVPAKMVTDPSKRSSSSFSFDSERGLISDSRLTDLGLSLRVQMAMVQGPMTMLSLETSGSKAALLDAQVFDAAGKPWPTTLVQAESGGGEEHSCQLLVAGKPTPPFSLAVTVGGVGASIAVPIVVENVPIGDQ